MPHPDNDDLRLSPTGIGLIVRFEGFEPDWYLDPVGVRTIGYGWTGALPDGLTPPLTEAALRLPTLTLFLNRRQLSGVAAVQSCSSPSMFTLTVDGSMRVKP